MLLFALLSADFLLLSWFWGRQRKSIRAWKCNMNQSVALDPKGIRKATISNTPLIPLCSAFFFFERKKMLSFANLPQNVLVGVRGTNILWRQGRNKKLSRMNKMCLRASVQPECTRMVRCKHVDIGVLYLKCVSLLSTRWNVEYLLPDIYLCYESDQPEGQRPNQEWRLASPRWPCDLTLRNFCTENLSVCQNQKQCS